jgi:hypothetical protein
MYDPEKAIDRETRREKRWTNHQSIVDDNGENSPRAQWSQWENEILDYLDRIEDDLDRCCSKEEEKRLLLKHKEWLDLLIEGFNKKYPDAPFSKELKMPKPDVHFVHHDEIKVFYQGHILFGVYDPDCGLWYAEFEDWVLLGPTIEALNQQITDHFRERRVKV